MSKQVHNTVAILAFLDQQRKAQLTAMRITEQPILLTKSKINRMGLNFQSIYAKNGQSKLVLVLVLILESKGLYCLEVSSALCVTDPHMLLFSKGDWNL